jgi:hypothetical protein
MTTRSFRRAAFGGLVGAALLLRAGAATAGPPGAAPYAPPPQWFYSGQCPTPAAPYPAPGQPAPPAALGQPAPGQPSPAQPFPGVTAPTPSADGAAAGAMGADTAFAPGAGAPVGGEAFSAVGYIDSAIPRTMFRQRFDAAYDDNRPDRADFFYPKCGCFKSSVLPGSPFFDPNAPGPPAPGETRVDYQELSSYLEIAASERLSGFVEIPVRFINPEVNSNEAGLGDVNFGFKYALLYDADRVFTLQVRTWAPTGDAFKGLGRNNWELEPAFLYWRRLSERAYLDIELRDYVPIDSADDFAGNVLRYGVGVSYMVVDRPKFYTAPVLEMVGWTVLGGKELTVEGRVKEAAGDTIVNSKIGVRVGFGERRSPGAIAPVDFYVGYGRALTGDVWYKDILRVEMRINF